MRQFKLFSVLAIVLLSSLTAQTKKAQAPKSPAATSSKAGEKPKFKAIWEPVNFKKDIELTDVAFVSALEGWVVGAKSTILHTKDGGKNWEVQMGGDADSADKVIDTVLFLDPTHGWGRGLSEKLLRTTDGSTWQDVGKVSGHFLGMNFVAPDTGFVVHSQEILRTDDGGTTWKPIFQCAMDLQVNGLARKVPCSFKDLAFVGQNGYGVGAILKSGFVARTKDGGNSWSVSNPAQMEGAAMQVYFWEANTGLTTLYGGKTLLTTDGGETWTGIVTPFGGEGARYAMGAGKFGVIVGHNQIAYSLNSGHSYSARPFPVPAKPRAVTFPDAQHGYVVGDHGMVYRYVIVPVNYSVAGMIDAPAV